jgi:hypothetical protein
VILEKEPDNKDINRDLMDAREELTKLEHGIVEVEDEPAPMPKA